MLWDAHKILVLSKLARAIGVLCISNYFLIWGTTTSKNIEKLARFQNHIVITNAVTDHPAAALLQKFGLIWISNFYSYCLWKMMKNETKINGNFISWLADIRLKLYTYLTWHPEYWEVSRTNYGESVLCYLILKTLKFNQMGTNHHHNFY